MLLEAGTKLGTYEITGRLGVGGMGEVYRARDPRLERDVAIKILPDALAQDPERRARFEREAKLLAALNHPGIATLHGVEEDSGRLVLVMELVEGETLAEKIGRGAIDGAEARDLFVQLARALEAAHAKGVLHRDLKPSNVMITFDGRVKILDFGLAKLAEAEPDAADVGDSQSPTLTKGTAFGAILGTTYYMSPEQSRGKPVDRRTDVWAFGCCLYEALTGRKAFPGETVTDILAAVLKTEPDFSRLPPETPIAVERTLRRCLRKNPAERLHDIADVRIELEDDVDERLSPAPSGWRLMPVAVAALAAVVTFVVSMLMRRETRPEPRRFEITFAPEESPDEQSSPVVSPDGRRIVYSSERDGTPMLFVRDLDRLESRALPGTEGARMPVFSPDGTELAFHDGQNPGTIRRIGIESGTPIDVASSRFTWWAGMEWGPDDTLVFSQGPLGLSRVALDSGKLETLTEVDASAGEGMHVFPRFLPDGEVLFTVTFVNNDVRTEVVNLGTNERSVVEGVGPFARFVESGHLVYPRGGSMLVVPFDIAARKTLGREAPLGWSVQSRNEAWREAPPLLDWSPAGTLVYVPPGGIRIQEKSFVWVEPSGRRENIGSGRWDDPRPRISPDGGRLAFTGEGYEIWVRDLDVSSPPRRLTSQGSHAWAVWSPDGRRLAFMQAGAGARANIVTLASDGSETEPRRIAAFDLSDYPYPSCWTPDGKVLVFDSESIWVIPADGASEPTRLFDTTFRERFPLVSPDGGLLAYTSTRSGTREVFLSPYPDVTSKPPVQVSRSGGTEPRWSGDGRTLHFREGKRLLAAAISSSGSGVLVGAATVLFELSSVPAYQASSAYEVAPDGRLLVVENAIPNERSRAVIVENWFTELERLAPR